MDGERENRDPFSANLLAIVVPSRADKSGRLEEAGSRSLDVARS